MRKLFLLTWALALFNYIIPKANAQAFLCVASGPEVVPAYSSSDGSVVIGDLFADCTGGIVPPTGTLLPKGNLVLSLSTLVLGTTQPLLTIDYPGPDNSLPCPLFAGCDIDSADDPYDGSSGHFNEFLGTVSVNQVTFYGVPIEHPGSSGDLLFQLTDISIDASSLPDGFTVQGYLSVFGSTAMPIADAAQPLATIVEGHDVGSGHDESATPEPSSGCLAGIALCLTALRKRRGGRPTPMGA
jgi:hypothetical protein